MAGIIAVVMVFAIPIIAILTSHFQKQSKYKLKMMESQLELEKVKHENYVLETQKMQLELEKMKLENPLNNSKLL